MGAFGDEFRFTLITNDFALAATAERSGINRVGLDLERLGKAERQAGEDTRLSEHKIEDLAAIARALKTAQLFVRLDPLNADTARDIENVLGRGAKVLMLPFFGTAGEVETFVRLVDRRAQVTVLIETAAAVVRIREILAVSGIDEVMIGLNDLRLALGVRSHFEILASPLLDALAGEVSRVNLPLSVGGVARRDDVSLPVSSDLVLAQFPRLGATGAWISRSFFKGVPADWDFAAAIGAVRRRLTEWAQASPEVLERARSDLAAGARAIALGP
jgi:hypothetical protein